MPSTPVTYTADEIEHLRQRAYAEVGALRQQALAEAATWLQHTLAAGLEAVAQRLRAQTLSTPTRKPSVAP